MSEIITVSPLPKTWLLDIDGTICKHNGYKLDGHDTLLPGAREFFDAIPEDDKIVFVTSRKREYAAMTEAFLAENGIRYHAIVYELPYGERILINDRKPSGLSMSVAVNTDRDRMCDTRFVIDESL